MSDLAPFIPAILRGLSLSKRADDMLVIVDRWITNAEHLEKVARFLGNQDNFDAERIKSLLAASIESECTDAIFEVLEACIKLYDADDSGKAKELFLECINYFTANKDARWLNHAWIFVHKTKLFDQLSADEVANVLDNLIYRPKIDYHDETLLEVFAKEDPNAVIKYFDSRLIYGREIDEDESEVAYIDQYEPVPFDFQKLNTVLSTQPQLMLDYSIKWYCESKTLFSFRGGRFVSNVFVEVTTDFRDKLIAHVKSGNIDHVDMVLAILRNYKGEVTLHPVCREIVLEISEDDQNRRTEVRIILESTGVVSGEYGFAEAYSRKKEAIKPWLEDKDEKVRKFAIEYVHVLEQQIASARRRAEQSIESRKRDYGEDDNSN